jgi:hypothetical protein
MPQSDRLLKLIIAVFLFLLCIPSGYPDIAGVILVASGADQRVTLINQKGCMVGFEGRF